MVGSLVLAIGLQLAAGSSAAAAHELVPGSTYDARIPTLKQVVGHDLGDEVASTEDIVRYLQALAAAAPDRTRLVQYARSWEGRPLYYLVIAAPQRIARLDQIKADLRRLADPRASSPAESERLARELPVVVALLHGVHGNEISSGGAAMAEAWHLLAAQNDPVADVILREAIVIVDPAQNPDGRARFVFHNRMGRAAGPDAEPAAAEHDEPWPGGRSNHYLFDLNRDWFAQTQLESAGRIAFLLEWMPHVVVDLHEMGGDSTYYFPPNAQPGNTHTTAAQKALLEDFGRHTASKFDERGFPYFTREVFDAFYPGYGVSWPMMQGAIGMTFEKASARGLAFRRRDGSVLTYYDGILEHFTAAMATAETAARNRERMLREFLEFRRSAVREGERGAVREYLIPPGDDPAQAERLARLLVQNGVDVRRALEPVNVGTRQLPRGTFIVPLAQPAGRVVRNLLDERTPMDEDFLKAQDERRARRLPDQIYDVTAWSLPLLYDVECLASAQPTRAQATPWGLSPDAPVPALAPAKVGYLLPWSPSTAAAVAEALASGLTVRVSGGPFTLNGRSFPIGTAVVRVSDNGPDVGRKLESIAARHGARAVGIDSAFVEQGTSLGSNEVRRLRRPRVLLAWDQPASSLSAGWARYVIERRYGQAVTAVRVASLGRLELDRYDVLVLPSGSYSPAIPSESLRRIRDWVSAGGTLVTVAEATRWAAREGVGLVDAKSEWRDGTLEGAAAAAKAGGATEDKAFDYERAIRPLQERPELVPGAILRVSLDTEHWLSSGTDGEIQAIVESQRVFRPVTLDKGRNVGTYATKDRLLASGILWPDSLEQLPRKAFLVHQPVGQGHVVAFAEDPNARAFAEATQLLFINAILLGPAF